jgi:hypothetical protein
MLKNTALYSRKKQYGHMRVGSSQYSPVNNGTRLNKEEHTFLLSLNLAPTAPSMSEDIAIMATSRSCLTYYFFSMYVAGRVFPFIS